MRKLIQTCANHPAATVAVVVAGVVLVVALIYAPETVTQLIEIFGGE